MYIIYILVLFSTKEYAMQDWSIVQKVISG